MSYNKFYTDKYKAGSLQLTNSAEMLIALYEKAMIHISAAEQAASKNDDIEWIVSLSKVQEIVSLLYEGLDSTSENDIIKHLETFYLQLNFHISDLISNKKDKDLTKLDKLMNAFRKLRDSWKDLEDRYNKEFSTEAVLDKI